MKLKSVDLCDCNVPAYAIKCVRCNKHGTTASIFKKQISSIHHELEELEKIMLQLRKHGIVQSEVNSQYYVVDLNYEAWVIENIVRNIKHLI